MKQAHVVVSGVVQGVGYRYFVRSNARKLGLTGWVRNTSNGKVEAVLQGSQQQVEKILALLRKGPMLSEVEDIQVVWEESEDKYEDLQIQK